MLTRHSISFDALSLTQAIINCRRIMEQTELAGQMPPEFESRAGDVIVRFRPSAYQPPSRVSHDLSSIQKEILGIIEKSGSARFADIQRSLSQSIDRRPLQNELSALKLLGLIQIVGRARAAKWRLTGSA